MTQRIRVAAAQYEVSPVASLAEYERKVENWLRQAAEGGAQLAVMPEYAALELVYTAERRQQSERRSPDRHKLGAQDAFKSDRRAAPDLMREARIIEQLGSWHDDLYAALSERLGLVILSPSMPCRSSNGELLNVASIFSQGAKLGSQAKMIPTTWERQVWGMVGGDRLQLFDTPLGKIGVTICFDTEFPQLARSLCEAGAELLLAPTCADSVRGYHRVALGARARAHENQCYVIQACTIGSVGWAQSVGMNVGAAGIFTVPDLGPNPDGTIALGSLNEPRWVFADLDLSAIRRLRNATRDQDRRNWEFQRHFEASEVHLVGAPSMADAQPPHFHAGPMASPVQPDDVRSM